jgi:hypothetical protein
LKAGVVVVAGVVAVVAVVVTVVAAAAVALSTSVEIGALEVVTPTATWVRMAEAVVVVMRVITFTTREERRT